MLDDELRAELTARRERGLARVLRKVPAGTLDLASNDYLGLARDSRVIEAAAAAARSYGAGARASRLVSGQNELHGELEDALANWKQADAALVFSSGWAANVAAITSLARRSDAIFCDKRNHASLIDACRLASSDGARVRYYNSTEKLAALVEASAATRKIIVSDAVYSMDGDLADVPFLIALARQHSCALILDDAHGTGTLGSCGRGAIEWWRDRATSTVEFDRTLQSIDLVQTGTLSKALGSQGGFVAASRSVIDWLVGAARPFVYSTGLLPAACGAALESLQIVRREPERLSRLMANTQTLIEGLREQGWVVAQNPSPIIPVIIGGASETVALSEELLRRGVWCPAIRPPTVPQGTSRLRITSSAALTDDEIQRALSALQSADGHVGETL